MKNVYLHIGMPRTATTFLQQFLFPNIPNISFYGVETAHYSEPFNKLQYADDSLYNPSIFNALIEEFDTKNLLISNEYLAGQSIYLNHVNRSIIAKRLKELFPDAKILLVLRNQIDLLQSLYAVNVQWKETRKIDDFIWTPFQEDKNEGGPSPSYYNTLAGKEALDGYNYLPLIKLYKSLFSDVTVLLFEDLIQQPHAFSEQLATFFQMDKAIVDQHIIEQPKINAGVSKKQAKKLIKLNKYSPLLQNSKLTNRIYNKLKRNIIQSKSTGDKPSFSNEKEELLKRYFRKDNLALSNQYPEIGIQNHSNKYYID